MDKGKRIATTDDRRDLNTIISMEKDLNTIIRLLKMEKEQRIATTDDRKDLNTIIHILDTNEALRDELATSLEYKLVVESLKSYIEKAYNADLKDIRYNQ